MTITVIVPDDVYGIGVQDHPKCKYCKSDHDGDVNVMKILFRGFSAIIRFTCSSCDLEWEVEYCNFKTSE